MTQGVVGVTMVELFVAVTWMDRLRADPAMAESLRRIRAGGLVDFAPLNQTAAVVFATTACQLLAESRGPVVFVTAHLDAVDDAADEAAGLLRDHIHPGLSTYVFPAQQTLPGMEQTSPEILAQRLHVQQQFLLNAVAGVVVCSAASLMQSLPAPDEIIHLVHPLKVGQNVDRAGLLAWLNQAGYRRVDSIDGPGQFAVRGGIVDLFPSLGMPVRLDLFGDELESLHEVDLDTLGSDRRIDRVEIIAADIDQTHWEHGVTLADMLPDGAVVVLSDIRELAEQGRSYLDRVQDQAGLLTWEEVQAKLLERASCVCAIRSHDSPGDAQAMSASMTVPPSLPPGMGPAELLMELVSQQNVVVTCQNNGEAQRLEEIIEQQEVLVDKVQIELRYLRESFVLGAPPDQWMLLPHDELMGRHGVRRRFAQRGLDDGAKDGVCAHQDQAGSERPGIDRFVEIAVGDLVVHRDHGVAKYIGITPSSRVKQSTDPEVEEYVTLEFAKRALVHVPVTRIDLVQKYIGAFHGDPKLSTLGTKTWAKQKADVAGAVESFAGDLLRVQAARSSVKGIKYEPDSSWQSEFEASFPYDETVDQLDAVANVKRDMERWRPMDRLICGDVGFGKTEVAVRAAFKAVNAGKQVAVLVPTTVLAEQHDRTFTARMAGYPMVVESLSRFKGPSDQKEIAKRVGLGEVDVLIGTHRILSSDIRFADLGLVIIDEEQRFGVEHKQRLLAMRATVDVLTLSATPIPRTLHMAMLGLRDISSLKTPPLDRRAVVTEVMAYEKLRIARALERELAREGQAFYLHNRVHSIESTADEVQRMVPNARIAIGHGQMRPRELERVMLAFIRREIDILVCTTIIESGIDIPNANTMIVDQAHQFGLAQLHQLRGRVGRYKNRAYCYLLLPRDRPPTAIALQRLKAIEGFSMLGAGYQIALRDLEIRGAGNLIGSEQSGHISVIGYEMYCRLLEKSVRQLKREPEPPPSPQVELRIQVGLPRGYIPSETRRLDAYRRLAEATDEAQLDRAVAALESAYGQLPVVSHRLVDLHRVRVLAAKLAVHSVLRMAEDLVFKTKNGHLLEVQLADAPGMRRVVGQPDAQGMVQFYYRPPAEEFKPDVVASVLAHRLRDSSSQPRDASEGTA